MSSTTSTTHTTSARRTVRTTALVAAAATLALAGGQSAAAATGSTTGSTTTAVQTTTATSTRLAGADRYATGVSISRFRFPTGAPTVYLVNENALADAVSAGTVGDGPILLVTRTGVVPASVAAEIRRLAPSKVVAIGGTGVVSDATLRAAAQGRATARLGGADRYSTAAAVVRHAYRPADNVSGDHATWFVNSTPLADSIAAGVAANPYEPVLPVPATGPAPKVITDVANEVNGGYAIAVGGTAVVSDATLRSAAPGQHYGRLAGANRYETAVALSGGTGGRPGTVYIASGESFVDALSAGSLVGGPLLLVRKDTAPQVVVDYVRAVKPQRVVVVGGTGVVSNGVAEYLRRVAG